jgi:hypothetical protein
MMSPRAHSSPPEAGIGMEAISSRRGGSIDLLEHVDEGSQDRRNMPPAW